MAKVTVLAAGRTQLSSSTFNVPAYGAVVVAPFSPDTLPKPKDATMKLVLVGSAGNTVAGDIDPSGPPVIVSNPTGEAMTYRVDRPAYPDKISPYDPTNGVVGIEVTGGV